MADSPPFRRLRNRDLKPAQDAAFGGTQGAGTYTPDDARDDTETRLNQVVLSHRSTFDPTGDGYDRHRGAYQALDFMLDKAPAPRAVTRETVEFQQYSTPWPYAFVVAWCGNLRPDDVVLEPSAGNGNIAVFARAANVSRVITNELSPRRAANLRRLGFAPFQENAEHLDSILPPDYRATAVLMNPPFSSTAGRMNEHHNRMTNGLRHVEQALLRLTPGGRLVAIIGWGEAPGFADAWNRLKLRYHVRAVVGVAGQAYARMGAEYPSKVIVVDNERPPEGHVVVTGDVESPGEIMGLLQQVRASRPAAARPPEPKQAGALFETAPEGPARARSRRRAGRSDPTGDLFQPEPQELPGPGPALQREMPIQTPSAIAVAVAAAADTKRDAITDAIFEAYRPRVHFDGAWEHPTPLVESAAMASVQLPDPTYCPRIDPRLIRGGILSIAQLEGLVYAGQSFEKFLPSGERQGFMSGDGTGVGKGRIGAAIMLESLGRGYGRGKALWVSANASLITAAQRDWRDLGGVDEDIFLLNDYDLADEIPPDREGICFVTFATLRTEKDDHARLAQILRWLNDGKPVDARRRENDGKHDYSVPDWDGVIWFDESHMMKSAITQETDRGMKQASQAAVAGCDLQAAVPMARVAYASATGFTETSNLGYVDRLGLWGPGTPFTNKQHFIDEIDAGGDAARELVALYAKAAGVYLARQLSFEGVYYERLTHTLTPEQRLIYDQMARAWQLVLVKLDEIIDRIAENSGEASGKVKAAAYSKFWGWQQRFFGTVINAMKMPTVLADMDRRIAEGAACVVQLVDTGGAALKRAMAKMSGEEKVALEDLDLTPRGVLEHYLRHAFPTSAYETYIDSGGVKRMRPVQDSSGKTVRDAEAMKVRDELLRNVEQLRIPSAPLDQIIDHFGVRNVAEVTARQGRIVRISQDGIEKTVWEPRSSAKCQVEVREYMDDKRQVLVFSYAGGVGASYHASRQCRNQRPRYHYLVQGGWVADRAIQGFGRSHRSDQAQPPCFVLCETDLRAEKRFISTIAKRLNQLGALTRGQRQAAGTGEMFSAADNLESKEALLALRHLYKDVWDGRIPHLNRVTFSVELGLSLEDEEGNLKSDPPPVTQFMNRLLSCTIDRQNDIFQEFETRIRAAVQSALDNGTLDLGVETVRAESITVVSDREVYRDPRTGVAARLVRLKMLRRIKPRSFAEVMEGGEATLFRDPIGFVRNIRSGYVYAVTLASNKTDEKNGDVIEQYRQIGMVHDNLVPRKQLDDKQHYQWLKPIQAKPIWEAQEKQTPEFSEGHGNLLVGAVLPIWDRLPKDMPKVWRCQTDDGRRLLGRRLLDSDMPTVLKKLGIDETGEKRTFPLDEVWRRLVVEACWKYELSNGWALKPSVVHSEVRIELTGRKGFGDGPQFFHRHELEAFGCFQERINSQWRWFVPNDEAGARQVLAKLTESKQIIEAHRVEKAA